MFEYNCLSFLPCTILGFRNQSNIKIDVRNKTDNTYLLMMIEYDQLCMNINVPTSELKSECLQKILIQAQKSSKSSELNPAWDEVTEMLWKHLQTGFNSFDDQLLCSICFYTALGITTRHDEFLEKITFIITEEFAQDNDKNNNDKTSQVVSLMYGIFQSAFLTKQNGSNVKLKHVLDVMFALLNKMAYEYSRFTFIAFKTINSFKKVCGTELQQCIYSKDNQVKLLRLINSNWENPITGIRDLNKEIFATVIKIIDEDMYRNVFKAINTFYWSKAKYLMLAEIIEQSNTDVSTLISNSDWLDGLSYSLHKPGLVSAGTDMYHAIFKKIKSEDEWTEIFLNFATTILSGPSKKAIENFSNYWWLTTLKKFPSLFKVVDQTLNNSDFTQIRYSKLLILRQANKQGIVNGFDALNSDGRLKDLLLDCDNYIRMTAFDIVCVAQSKTMPSEYQYNLVLSFLHDNINSDCSVLRQSMLNSFSNFLVQTNLKFFNTKIEDHNELLHFTAKIQEFLIETLKTGGNYQRKITCVKLFKLFLTSLDDIPRKKQKQTRLCNKSIIDLLKAESQLILSDKDTMMKLLYLLNDPAEDIRDNVVELLLNQYSEQLMETCLFEHLIENALSNIQSKFFYQIGCGQSMFKLISNILSKQQHLEARFKSIEDVFSFAHNELTSEYKLQRDVLECIEVGKQLHSFISILQTVLEVCLQKGYMIEIEPNVMGDLLNVLEGISGQFLWEDGVTSSDFSKMSEMVECMINKSHCIVSDKDETKISGLHQIVLNCLWLNVKASCDLASLLVQYKNESDQMRTCQRCLGVITHVLETCRHKGAIEAAGVALGQSIRYLTSLPDRSLSKLPNTLLRTKLDELISEASKMASVTRRGAGLSIMVHRIVSSDMKRGKPLFHYFMSRLLEACGQTDDIPSTVLTDIDNEKDLPKAIYIHFFTRIVTDSTLSSDVMFYAADLAELAFSNLTNSFWQIRNAALQLYGSLIPKLIGQKKASGDEETIATVACDELRTHSPKMWTYMLHKLGNPDTDDQLQRHSNLVPILNILANIARSYNFSLADKEENNSEQILLSNLFSLLGSPIHTVRRLTAKAICNIFPFEIIYNTLLSEENISENYLHGSLMLTLNCHTIFNSNGIYENQFQKLKSKFCGILMIRNHSYICKELYETAFYVSDFEMMEETLAEVKANSNVSGIHSWAINRAKQYLKATAHEKIPKLLQCFLLFEDFADYCKAMLQKIKNDKLISPEILSQIAAILLDFEKKFNSDIIWEILYEISLTVTLDIPETILHYFDAKEVTYKLRYMLPFIARISAFKKNVNCLASITNVVHLLVSSDTTDVDMRYIAAITINENAFAFKKLHNQTKIDIIKCVILLLQDEDEDIRNITVNFYITLTNTKNNPHPYYCLQNILTRNFLKLFLDIDAIIDLCNNLGNMLSDMTVTNTDEYNPFASDSKNIYLEVVKLKMLIENLKTELK